MASAVVSQSRPARASAAVSAGVNDSAGNAKSTGGMRYPSSPVGGVCSGMPSSRSSCLSRSKVRKNASSLGASEYPATLSLIHSADR